MGKLKIVLGMTLISLLSEVGARERIATISSEQVTYQAKRYYAQFSDESRPSPLSACTHALHNFTSYSNYKILNEQCVSDMQVYESERKADAEAKDAESNGAFPLILSTAVKTSFDEGTTDNACRMAYESLKYSTESKESQIARCDSEIKAAYSTELMSGKRIPKNCIQWSIVKGGEWTNAVIKMRYSPLSQPKTPVSFWGRITDANPSKLVVNGEDGNAIIVIDKSTVVFRPERIQVGGSAFGFGIHTGKATVKLVSGAQTTVPLITAACIQ